MKKVTVSRAFVRYARDLARSGLESNDGSLNHARLPDGPKFIKAAADSVRHGSLEDAGHPVNVENLRRYREACVALGAEGGRQ